MAVATDSKSNVSVSIIGRDNSTRSLSKIRPTLQDKNSMSSRRLSRNASIPANDSSKLLKNSNSAQRLSQLKKQLSLRYKRSDSYQKIDSNAKSFNQSWNDNSASHRMDSLTNSKHPYRGMRRRRSCGDDVHSLYKAAAMAIEQGAENEREYQSEELHLHERNVGYTNLHSIVPSVLSSPNMRYESAVTLSSNSSRSSDKASENSSVKSSSDFLARATAVAGRKQRAAKRPPSSHPPPASSSDLSSPIAVSLGQKLSTARILSSPHLSSRSNPFHEETQRRQSDSAMDPSGFAVVSTPRARRRSRRLIPNETVMLYSNDALNDKDHRREMFRKDFPEEPIPSDAILMRLYGNMTVPPPPQPPLPYRSGSDEQASASNGSMGTPNSNRSSNFFFRAPVLSPQDMPKNSDEMTFTSELEWKAWKESVDKPGRRDESRRSESSKSIGSSKRSSSKSKLVDASDRSYSHSHSLSGHRSRGHKTRRGSKSNDLTSEAKTSKSKGSRRYDIVSHSSHRKNSSQEREYGPPKNKSRKSGETMKVRSKTASKKTSSDGSQNSDDYEAFQALLDLSNGSFFDSNDDLAELKSSESLNFLRNSLKSVNSAPKMNASWNDSTNSFGSFASFASFAEGDETATKERKKKRKGKRGEGKIRSRSADENRDTSTKSSRRGKRSSKQKPNSNDDSKTSLHSSWYGESDTLLFDSSLRGEQWTSNAEREPEKIAKQHQSPRFVARKSSGNEGVQKQRRNSTSPKLLNKKELATGSPGSLSVRKRNKKGSSSKTNSSGDADPSLEQGSTNTKNNDEFELSSWGDKPAEKKGITAEDIIATARDILASPKELMGTDLAGNSRWTPEPSPVLNAMSPRSDDTTDARVPRIDAMPIPDVEESVGSPPPQPTTPPRSPRKLDFPLNFMEYQNVSPLTIASKKVSLPDVELMSALNYLDA